MNSAIIPNDVKRAFGLALKTWRAQLHISQEELAFRAGLHRTYISGIESGTRNPTLETISKLAQSLNISLSETFAPLGEFPKNSDEQTAPLETRIAPDNGALRNRVVAVHSLRPSAAFTPRLEME